VAKHYTIHRLLVPSKVDRVEIVHLDETCFPADDTIDPARDEWWIARNDRGGIVGYASARPLPSENAVFLSRAGVLPEARGSGLQLRLIRARLRWSRRLRYQLALTYTTPDNHASANNLIRSGFMVYQPVEYWAGSTAVYWRKDLREPAVRGERH
jgi:GNAT superfamily N-acetyltransferase